MYTCTCTCIYIVDTVLSSTIMYCIMYCTCRSTLYTVQSLVRERLTRMGGSLQISRLFTASWCFLHCLQYLREDAKTIAQLHCLDIFQAFSSFTRLMCVISCVPAFLIAKVVLSDEGLEALVQVDGVKLHDLEGLHALVFDWLQPGCVGKKHTCRKQYYKQPLHL